jgi:hypothetical protein
MRNEEEHQPGGELLLYQTEDGRTRLECRFEHETLWLTQAHMADLFQTTPQNITLHLKAIYAEGEQNEEATCKPYLQVRQEGGRSVRRQVRHYRLEVVLAVGFRVRSPRGTQFRQWATSRVSFASRNGRWKPGNRPAVPSRQPRLFIRYLRIKNDSHNSLLYSVYLRIFAICK